MAYSFYRKRSCEEYYYYKMWKSSPKPDETILDTHLYCSFYEANENPKLDTAVHRNVGAIARRAFICFGGWQRIWNIEELLMLVTVPLHTSPGHSVGSSGSNMVFIVHILRSSVWSFHIEHSYAIFYLITGLSNIPVKSDLNISVVWHLKIRLDQNLPFQY